MNNLNYMTDRQASSKSSSEFIAILTAHGFYFVSKRGSHAKYRDSNGHTFD
jgi:predicted RNA binding protein YcfA (HicA-like mRNA interferase family)